TATMSHQPREGIDFFPLTCDYEERMYSVGKIPGGFFKREGRPGERAILTSRLIDRPIRPLFPDGMRHDVQIVAMPLSVDQTCPPDMVALNAASAALTLSGIPWDGPIAAARVGMVDGELVLNPSREQIDGGDLELVVAGTAEAILMVEAGASEIPEAQILEAMRFGHDAVREICLFLQEWRAAVGKPRTEVPLKKVAPDLVEAAREFAGEIRANLFNPDKALREGAVSDVKKVIAERLAERFPERTGELGEAIEKVVKLELRAMILQERRRPDGRGPEDIREISCEVGLLPRTHGSALFTRGQTQVLSVATLGGTSEDQMIDGLGEEVSKDYMHHYNFPPFSVGEVKRLGSPGRREIGHGALAERALRAVLPGKDQFPYVIRVVSDVMESNGSTSMGSTCGSTMALMDAGVPIKAPVSGIAMGLMTEGEQYVVLSDIQGVEDFGGDMDFKVTGTETGVTAMQLDTKISGIPWPVMEEALAQARRGRLHIMDRMLAPLSTPREELSGHAPRIITLEISPDKIGELIGPGGKNIKKIQADTNTKVDIQQDGKVFVAAQDGEQGARAVQMIEAITKEVAVGSVFTGKITRLMGKGAMVEYSPGREGLIPTHELSHHPIGRPDDVVKVGDEVQAKVVSVDSQGRVDLSRKACLDPETEPAPETISPPRPPRGGFGGDRGGDRGDRGGFGGDRGGDRGGRGGFRGDRDRDRDRDRPRGGDRPPRPDYGSRGDIPPRPAPVEGPGAGAETGVGARFRPLKRQPEE
ncbi:MAG: polyribonucleotide nucleotidyltransferase, partial [Armatimonadetes bacterium]|nr:polyribonucleotide nucleotidyltransferase [Armatimonadota bacterium]